jgi:hypothetical protein
MNHKHLVIVHSLNISSDYSLVDSQSINSDSASTKPKKKKTTTKSKKVTPKKKSSSTKPTNAITESSIPNNNDDNDLESFLSENPSIKHPTDNDYEHV